MKNKIGFETNYARNNQKSEEVFSLEDYKDSWVLINLKGNGSFMGYLSGIDSVKARFLPYQKFSYKDNGIGENVIIYEGKPKGIERIDIVGYRPGSEKESLNFCQAMNKKAYIEFLREQKEIYDLENYLRNQTNKNKIILP